MGGDGVKIRGENVTVCVAWLHDILLFAGCYVIVPALLEMETAQANRYFAGCLWLLVPIILSWLCIRKIKMLALYLLVCAAAAVCMNALSGCLLTGILTALIFLIRGYVRIKRGKLKKMLQEMPGEAGAELDKELWELPTLLDAPEALHWMVFAGYYVILLYLRKGSLLNRIFFLAVVDVFLVFIFEYLSGLRIFLEDHGKIANLPKKSVKKAGHMLLALALPLLLLFVLPSVLYHREPLTELKFELPGVPVMPETEEMEPIGSEGEKNPLAALMQEEMKEPPAWIRMLSEAFTWMFSAAVLIFCIILIYRLCRHAMRSFAAGEEDRVIFTEDEEEEQAQPVLRKKRHFWQRTDEKWKIRRQYKRAIRKTMPGTPEGWETPRELEEKANAQSEAVSKELHELYEKARYL